MPEGGPLTIETAEVVIDQEFADRHPWATTGQYVLLSVADQGAGMDANTLERAFEPFFSTKPPGAGTGLGLATVYGIVKQHRGIVHAFSEPGQGSVFHVYLPVASAARSTAVEGNLDAVAGGHETILLAEDDVAVRDLAKQVLVKAGYQVFVAANGREAVSLFARHVAEVDLLLMDVVMPDLGGLDAVDLIRKIRPDVPAILASGYDDRAVGGDDISSRGLGLLRKPFGRVELLRAIREALAEGQASRTQAP
jgi:CheY-like chemotaxis protein